MSADAPAAEAAAAAEVLDLNADAAAVDSHQQGGASVADETKPAPAETRVEPSAGSRESVGEGLNGEGRGPTGDAEREVVVGAGDVDGNARLAADVVTGGREALEGMVSTVGDVEERDDRSGRSAEASVHQSTGPEISEGKTEAAVQRVDGAEDAEYLSLRAENRIVEGSTESDGDKSSLEVDHVVQEISGKKLVFPVGSEAGVDVGAIHVNSQPTNEKDDSVDVVAPELNSAVDSVQAVESENLHLRPVVEKLGDQGNVVVAESNIVTGTSTGEIQGEGTLMAGETTERKVHAVVEDSALLATIISLSGSQASENQTSDCAIRVGVSTDVLDDKDQEMGEEHEDTSKKPPSGGVASANGANLVGKLPALDQHGDPEDTSINGGRGASQVTECVAVYGSDLVAEECLPESSQLDQNLPSVLKEDPSQVGISASQFLSENQSTEVQHVGSLFDENQGSQPTLVAGQDVCLTTSAGLETAHEPIETDIDPSEEMPDQEVNLNKKEDDGVNLSSDVVENEVARSDTERDEKELKLRESLEKEDKLEKSSTINPDAAGTENEQRASYHLPQEDKKVFSISNLVWGKVKSHPWWPGQIFNPSDASDMALKHQKRDNFLVGYFGDKTFAWCDESKLKPFRAWFSLLENQSTSDAFINAVNSAVAEVSRRLELGMSCICVLEELLSNVKHQKIENAGIREGSSCSVVDNSFGVATFEPNSFLDYIKALALYPLGGMDKLELVIAKAQLMAFNRSRCIPQLPASVDREGLIEKDAVTPPSQRKRHHKALGERPSPTSANEEMVFSDLSAEKQKKKLQGSALHRPKHMPEHSRKQKSLSELMDDKNRSDLVNGDGTATEMMASGKSFVHSSGKKRKKDDSISPYPGKSKRKRLDALGDLEKKTPTSDRSFKVGECISRVASKLTGSPSIIKINGESLKTGSTGKSDQGSPQVFDASLHTPEDTRRRRRGILKNYSSPAEMLSQLCLAAKDPMKGYSFLSSIICFFTEVRELRDSGSMVDKRFEKIKKKRGRKKKSESNDGSKNKLSGTPKPSDSVIDVKPSKKIRRKRGRKKKSEESKNESKTDATEASTPDYMTDSYWTDRIVCGTPEEKSESSRRKRKGELLMQSTTKKTNPLQESLPLSKMLEGAHHLRISAVSPTANRDSTVEKQATFFGEKCLEESTPTALILSFNEPDALPSETNLIRIFSRYGPLKEAETEVMCETNCAKVVFKRRADAEIAFSSAGKYCIFGPALVSYRLRYLPSTPMASPEVRSNGRKDTKTSDDVSLETPAQEANELVKTDAKGLAQEEMKESAWDEAKEFTQEEAKQLAQDEVKDLAQDEMKELAQEEKELAREAVHELTEEGMKELTRAEAKEFIQEDVKELAQDEVKDLAQDDMKELCEEEAKESAQEEVKELTQEEAKELAQAEAK